MRYLLIGLAVLTGLVWLLHSPSSSLPPVKIVTLAPEQTPTAKASFAMAGYTLIPVAAFTVNARLLSKSIYRFGREADLSPVDYALGWQLMAQPRVLKDIDIGQGHRTYHWRTRDFPIPREQIESQSANMHLIPASDEIRDQLKSMPEDSLVRLSGFLVNITAPDGWRWHTSTIRTDTGDGACEVFYVTEVARGAG